MEEHEVLVKILRAQRNQMDIHLQELTKTCEWIFKTADAFKLKHSEQYRQVQDNMEEIEDNLMYSKELLEEMLYEYTGDYAWKHMPFEEYEIMVNGKKGRTVFKVNELTPEAQEIMHWFMEYKGAPDGAAEFVRNMGSEFAQASEETGEEAGPGAFSDYIIKLKNIIAGRYENYDECRNFRSFYELVAYAAKVKAEDLPF